MLDALGGNPVISPDGKYLAFARGSARRSREAYDGPAAADIWLYDIKANTYKKLTENPGNDFMPVWSDSKTIYFISSFNGKYNVFKMNVEGQEKTSTVQQVTYFEDGGVRHLSMSRDGSTIALERETDIYVMKTTGGSPMKVKIDIASDYRFDPEEFKNIFK
jgi:tricorn protease